MYYTCLPNILVSRVSALFKSIIRLHGRVTLGVTPANLTQAVVGHPGVLAEGSHVFPSGNCCCGGCYIQETHQKEESWRDQHKGMKKQLAS